MALDQPHTAIVIEDLNVVTCPICQDQVKNPKTLACEHQFCVACVDPWLKENPTCPMCRAPQEIIVPQDLPQVPVDLELPRHSLMQEIIVKTTIFLVGVSQLLSTSALLSGYSCSHGLAFIISFLIICPSISFIFFCTLLVSIFDFSPLAATALTLVIILDITTLVYGSMLLSKCLSDK